MLRPLDLQDNFSKAPLAAREQHIQQLGSQAAQQHLAREVAQEHVLDHSRVRPSDETEEPQMHVRGRNPGNPGQRQQKRRRDGEPYEEDEEGHIDLIA